MGAAGCRGSGAGSILPVGSQPKPQSKSTNIHPMDAYALALHSPEPGHLAFGELMYGYGE